MGPVNNEIGQGDQGLGRSAKAVHQARFSGFDEIGRASCRERV